MPCAGSAIRCLQEINFKEGDRTFDTQVAVIKQADPDAVVFWGNPARD